jgi:hypothetical protein
MDQEQSAQLVYLFREYWPTFSIASAIVNNGVELPGTIDAWSGALAGFTVAEVSRALMIFRGDAERKFAPTVSEFCGRLSEIRKEEQLAADRKLALEAPGELGEDGLEYYKVEVGVGRNKDGSAAKELRTFCRASKAFRERYDAANKARGLRKEFVNLPNGKVGSYYVRDSGAAKCNR